jgi:hypothetical protein
MARGGQGLLLPEGGPCANVSLLAAPPPPWADRDLLRFAAVLVRLRGVDPSMLPKAAITEVQRCVQRAQESQQAAARFIDGVDVTAPSPMAKVSGAGAPVGMDCGHGEHSASSLPPPPRTTGQCDPWPPAPCPVLPTSVQDPCVRLCASVWLRVRPAARVGLLGRLRKRRGVGGGGGGRRRQRAAQPRRGPVGAVLQPPRAACFPSCAAHRRRPCSSSSRPGDGGGCWLPGRGRPVGSLGRGRRDAAGCPGRPHVPPAWVTAGGLGRERRRRRRRMAKRRWAAIALGAARLG